MMCVGHTECYWLIINFIYLFHMPLFFIAAGYFFSKKYEQDPWLFCKKRFKGLYVPFVKWSLLFLVLHNLMFKIGILNEQYGNWENGVTHPYSLHDFCQRLVHIVFSMGGYDEFLAGGEAVAVVGEVAAADADGVDFLDIFGDGHQTGHRAEGLPEKVGVQAGDDDADAAVGERLGDFNDAFVKKLGFVDTDDLHVGGDVQHPGRRLDRGARDGRGVMGYDIEVRITLIDGRLENLDFLLGELGAFEPADQFFRLAGEHGAADDFDAARFFCVFQKHFLTLL